MKSFNFSNVSLALPSLARNVMNGDETGSRNGACRELTHVALSLKNPWRREILVDARKANLAAQIAETMWVLAGRNDIEFLSHYLPRAADFSDDGTTWRAGYGPRIRKWYSAAGVNELYRPIDQLSEVIELLSRDPLSRRAVINIFDPAQDFVNSKDIPCNNWISFTNRLGYLEMHVAIRSNDLMWGWSGINQFEWSVLQEIVAGMLGVRVGPIHYSIASLHIYAPHWEKAQRVLQTPAKVHTDLLDSPRFNATGVDDVEALDELIRQWFVMEERIRTSRDTSAFSLLDSDIHDFPEPMLQSWLRVLRWWWTGDPVYLGPLSGTRLEYAARVALQPPSRKTPVEKILEEGGLDFHDKSQDGKGRSDFINALTALHDEKHAAYGDSWMKRGELFSIIPNIARKIDRLGESETADETSADTAGDLFVYLAKYRGWLFDQSAPPATRSATTAFANNLLAYVEQEAQGASVSAAKTSNLVKVLKEDFDLLASEAERGNRSPDLVDQMLPRAYVLARRLWEAENREIPRTGVLRDLLLLVGVQVSKETIKRWSDHQKRKATEWASLVHLAASDNDVEIPNRPEFLPAEGDDYRGAHDDVFDL